MLNLINQIKKQSKNINPIIISNFNQNKKNFSEFKNIKVIRSKVLNDNFYARVFNKLQIIIFGKDFFFEKFLIKNQIDILSHFFATGRNSRIKSLFWFPDFQEIHDLKYISLKRKILRKINFIYSVKNSTKIVLSSNTVKNDLKKINTEAYKNAMVLKPFFVTPYKVNDKNICKKYNLKSKFFLLPNQYWKHKNHILVLKVLKALSSDKFRDIQVVSTGYFNDYRFPNYKYEISKFIKNNNLQNSYKVLGIIPYKDLMDLMYYSIAVINPSKSEGWSSTVEQAKSMGKMVLLSDLKVHIEQSPFRKFYFSVNDEISLKRKIIEVYKKFNFETEKKKMKIAKKKLNKDKMNFINDYIKEINKLI